MCWSEKDDCKVFLKKFACRKCEGNIGKVVELKEKLCDVEDTVRELTYSGGRLIELCRSKWSVGVIQIANRLRRI